MFAKTIATALSAALMGGALALGAAAAAAEEVKLFKEGEVPSAEELGRIFYKPRTRAIVMGGQQQPAGPEAFAFPIHFALNSAQITDKAVPYLDAVGKMMQMDQSGKVTLIVEGHTDATGGDSYNLALSQKRADAVKDYLVAKYGIDATRVTAIGKGETELYNTADPASWENRRVQFRRGG